MDERVKMFTDARRQGRVFVIAEIGKNFIQTEEERPVSEYLENAKALVKAADEAGADAVKFQTHNVEDEQLNIEVASPHFKGADRYSWVSRNTNATPLETFWKPLKEYADRLGIVFFSTPMSRGAARVLNALGVELWKVGSGDILDFPLLDYIASTGKPIVLSSGMSTLEELDTSIDFLKRRGANIALLHCVSKYPCPPEELRLGTMHFLAGRYNVPVGFSDHSLSTDSAVIAVAMGARIVEKHFSFSRGTWGPDHKASLTPDEFRDMTAAVRRIENNAEARDKILSTPETQRYFGGEGKVLQEDEAVFRPLFRKSLMAGQDIPSDSVITSGMLYAMRPQAYAGGLPSEKYEDVLGKRTKRAIKKYEPFTFDILES